MNKKGFTHTPTLALLRVFLKNALLRIMFHNVGKHDVQSARAVKTMPKLVSGFTLIELLVVIAIIGILAAVVLASLNAARAKGVDTAIKATLGNFRTQAQNYYDTNESYGTAGAAVAGASPSAVDCSTANTVFDPSVAMSIYPAISSASNISSGVTWSATCTMTALRDAWAVSVPLKTNNTLSWCVDSMNNGRQITGALPFGQTVCP